METETTGKTDKASELAQDIAGYFPESSKCEHCSCPPGTCRELDRVLKTVTARIENALADAERRKDQEAQALVAAAIEEFAVLFANEVKEQNGDWVNAFGTAKQSVLKQSARTALDAYVASAYRDALWAVDEAHRRNISGENWHHRVHNFVASREPKNARAALDALVAERVKEAVEKEREACAMLADTCASYESTTGRPDANKLAAAIRGRG